MRFCVPFALWKVHKDSQARRDLRLVQPNYLLNHKTEPKADLPNRKTVQKQADNTAPDLGPGPWTTQNRLMQFLFGAKTLQVHVFLWWKGEFLISMSSWLSILIFDKEALFSYRISSWGFVLCWKRQGTTQEANSDWSDCKWTSR